MERGGDHINEDTGEILSTSDAAIVAGVQRERAEMAASLGVGKTALYAALMAAVCELPAWVKSESTNPAFKRGGKDLKYASLKDIIVTVRPALHKQGIRIRQGSDRSWPLDDGGGTKGRLVPVYTDLIHTLSGEVDRTIVEIPILRMDAQAMGSALTYGRRYSLLSALGLAVDEADDDGESAKLTNISDVSNDSPELARLTAELVKFKTAPALVDWASEAPQQKKHSQLDAGERATLTHRYLDKLKQLEAATEEAPAKKGAK